VLQWSRDGVRSPRVQGQDSRWEKGRLSLKKILSLAIEFRQEKFVR